METAMSDDKHSDLGDALAAISKLKLSPEDGVRFIAIVKATFGDPAAVEPAPVATAEPAVKRGRRGNGGKNAPGVQFKGHLKALVQDSPKQCKDLIEPLRERGVILPEDVADCVDAIELGFRKSKSVYRRYPDNRWGLMSYPTLRSVG
jgi:hypothetical protein